MADEFDLTIKRNDLEPPFEGKVAAGGVLDLTTAVEIRMIMRKEGGTPIVCEECEGDAEGNVTYEWKKGDTAIAGEYDCEVQVEFVSGRPATFPKIGYKRVKIEPDLDEAPV